MGFQVCWRRWKSILLGLTGNNLHDLLEFLYFAEPGDEFALFFGDEEGERSTVFDFEGFGDFRGCDSAGSWGDIELGDL